MSKPYDKFKSYTTAQQAALIAFIFFVAAIVALPYYASLKKNKVLTEWQRDFELTSESVYAKGVKDVSIDDNEITVAIGGTSDTPFADGCSVIKDYQRVYERNTGKKTIVGSIFENGSIRSKFKCDDSGLRAASR